MFTTRAAENKAPFLFLGCNAGATAKTWNTSRSNRIESVARARDGERLLDLRKMPSNHFLRGTGE